MASNTKNTNTSQYSYGVHFPQTGSDGYFLIRPLAEGVFGRTALVLGSDGKVYVIKFEKLPTPRAGMRAISREVRNHIEHSNIPKLMSYEEVDSDQGTKTTTVWEYCNGGTLYELIGELYALADQELPATHTHLKPQLPEVFIWRFLESMMSILTTIYSKNIGHNDIHERNVFLHWPTETSMFPEVFLGDFGLSEEFPGKDHPNEHWRNAFKILELDYLDPKKNARADRDFNLDSVREWFRDITHELAQIVNLLVAMISPASDSGSLSEAEIQMLLSGTGGVCGYSVELSRACLQLMSAFELFQSWGENFRPFQAMNVLRDLHKKFTQSTNNAHAKYDPKEGQRTNILQYLRRPLPDPEPTMWPTLAVERQFSYWAVVTAPKNEWRFDLDYGTYTIRRMTKNETGNWVAMPYDDYTEDESDQGLRSHAEYPQADSSPEPESDSEPETGFDKDQAQFADCHAQNQQLEDIGGGTAQDNSTDSNASFYTAKFYSDDSEATAPEYSTPYVPTSLLAPNDIPLPPSPSASLAPEDISLPSSPSPSPENIPLPPSPPASPFHPNSQTQTHALPLPATRAPKRPLGSPDSIYPVSDAKRQRARNSVDSLIDYFEALNVN